MNTLALIWVLIIALGIILYVVLDGFDLGIGIMSIFFPNEHHRDLMFSTVLPVWDGNETWLVLGGALLYGAFPLAFATVFPALYIPLLVMVVGLIFRGVSFEFRMKAHRSKKLWELSFFIGSLVVTVVQGLVLGAFVNGFKFDAQGHIILAFYQWFTPFGMICSIALIFGYALLGSNWLIRKTVGDLQNICYHISHALQYVIVVFAALVSIWSPFLDPRIKAVWFGGDHMFYLLLLPLLMLLAMFFQWYGIRKRKEHMPFWSMIGVFVTCYVGFGISTFPYMVPRQITYIQAASNDKTLIFMLVGAAIMLPVLLFYTYYSYKIFRGKVTEPLEY